MGLPGSLAACLLAALPAAAEVQDPPLGRGAAFGVIEVEPMVRVAAGTALRSRPDPQAETLVLFEVDAEVPILARRGRWIRTFHHDATGWLAPDGEPSVEEFKLEALETGYLVLDTSPEEKATRIADARSFLGTENTDFRALGAWPLYTDVTDAVELTRLDRVARQVREVYEKRFGLRPADAPSRVVVLYRDEESYRRFTQEFTDIGEIHGDGHADGAMAALFLADTREIDTAAILAHELTHLVNRDVFLGPVKTWVEEGLANDLGFSRIDARGNIAPGTLGARNTRNTSSGGQYVWSRLLEDWREDRTELLPVTDLLDLAWAEFINDRHRRSNYAQSTFLIRYLLDEGTPENRSGFQEFLAIASRGGPSSAAALTSALGVSEAELRSEYEQWLSRSAEAAR